MTDIISGLLLMIGALFSLVAAVGIARLPDIYIRMHAATKAGALGAGMIMLAVGVHSLELEVMLRAAVAVIFILLTAPIAAHLLGRAAYLTRVPLWSGTTRDELAGKYDPLSSSLAGATAALDQPDRTAPADVFPEAKAVAVETDDPGEAIDPLDGETRPASG